MGAEDVVVLRRVDEDYSLWTARQHVGKPIWAKYENVIGLMPNAVDVRCADGVVRTLHGYSFGKAYCITKKDALQNVVVLVGNTP